jgi:hypothetical protein
MGVSSWRILLMVETESNKKYFKSLIGNKVGIKRFSDQIVKRLLEKHTSDWHKRMNVQFVRNDKPNSVIIVSPNGEYYTESNIPYVGKILIDQNSPSKPSNQAILEKVDMFGHTERYLNLHKEF